MAENKKLNLSAFEKVWYILTGAITLWGLTYIILGLIAQYADVSLDKNYLLEASNSIQNSFGLGFFGWGIILLVIGVVLAVVVLLSYATKIDRTSEKAARRAARMAKIEAEMSTEQK